MLKRNGEVCQAEVPDYPGRLTATEKRAYSAAAANVEGHLRELAEAARALSDVEKQIPQWKAGFNDTSAAPIHEGMDKPAAGDRWHLVKTLVKTSRSDLLFCARAVDEGREFAVFEKFDPHSAYAQTQGNPELLLTGDNALGLLEVYLESERRMLQLVKQNIEAAVEESLTEKFPGEDHSRVVRAISARCDKCISPDGQDVHSPRTSPNMRIRF
jgi:hypothetical protein